MAGRGSLAGLLPYGDANAIVVDMASEVLPVVRDTPVLAGVCGTDPFRLMEVFLPELKRIGFSGVQNFPTVGLFDGKLRQNLEETGMGYPLEVEMIRAAHELDMVTAPYVFTPEDAIAMTAAGADVLVPHMGLTTKGSIGAQSALRLEDRAAKDHVSRGQQKMVAAGLMLAQLEIQELERPGRSALLLDDPSAELDAGNLSRLMSLVRRTPAQLWVTSLRPEIAEHLGNHRVFHVEQGSVRRL